MIIIQIYTFSVNKIEEIEEVEILKNESGEEVKQLKKVKKETPVYFSIRKPTRALFDDAELYYGIKLAESIKAGMLTKTSMLKKYDGDGGIFTKGEEDVLNKLVDLLKDKQKALNELTYKEEEGEVLTDQQNQNKSILQDEITFVKNQMIEIENSKSALFDQTAETRARNKSIVWWILHLAYSKNEENFTPLFGEGGYESRLNKYDELEESGDEFWQKVLLKYAYLVSFWYSGKIMVEEDFKAVENYYDSLS